MLDTSHIIMGNASGRYHLRAKGRPLWHNFLTMRESWRTRLEEAVAASDKSASALSLEAGTARNYLYSILKEGREPTIAKLLALCDVLKVSPVYLLYGFDVDPETADLIVAIQGNPRAREALLSLLGAAEGS